MKFLCDRCKTRYSIGDDRVRGKILKIRCKNCNNVITVREGMPELGPAEPAAPEPAQRRQKQMTQAVTNEQLSAGNGALGAAFASAMTKPPPALEEEWYVSIDGDQAGPFSLAEAQRWVAGKAHDAELHCWSEGFDDWLAVDKVSHFRGLRKKPLAPLAPPPLPRAATGAIRSVPRAGDDEPKPLFAATMASIEKSSPSLSAGGGIAIPSIAPASPSGRGTPLGGHPAMPMAARSNGNAAARAPAPRMQPVAAPALIGRAPAVKPLFDVPAAESATQIETPAFDDDPQTAAEPVAAVARAELPGPARDPFANDVFAKADPFGKPQQAPLDTTQQIGDLDIDGDLDIGEVSRVVNLADLKRPEPKVPAARAASVAPQRSGQLALGRTGSAPSIPLGNRSGAAISIPGALGPDGLPLVPGDAALAPIAPQVAVSHRRGMIALMVGALLLLGAAGVIVFVVMSENEHTSGGLGNKIDYDTTRPDDPRRSGSNGSAAVVADVTPPTNPFVPKQRVRPSNPPPLIPTNPDAKPLRPDEIEEMAAKNNGTTQRCYIRSQRGTEAILLADVKRLSVTLTVDKDGVVTNVGLSDHATSSLGKCLISTIRGWKFRASAQGITAKITMVFQSG